MNKEEEVPEQQFRIYQYPDGQCELMPLKSGMANVPAGRMRLEGDVLVISAIRQRAQG